MQKQFVIEKLPTDFCHASAILRLSAGKKLCCWFGGRKEGTADVAVWCSRYDNGYWSGPCKLANGLEANWNPVLFAIKDKIMLFFKEGQKISNWKTLFMESYDKGESWSEPTELVAGDESGGRGPVRNKPILLTDGRIIAGGSTERGLWKAFADYSDDGGRTWKKSADIGIKGLLYKAGEKTAESDIAVSMQSFYGRGVIQPALWESAPGKIHMLLRSSEGFIYRSDSDDNGMTWLAAYPTQMPNNNSGIDLVKAPFDGCLYLVCNPVAANWGMRSPLSLFKSSDNGCSWQKITDLETDAGEFSYPAIIADAEGIDITYTWQRKNIVCCRLNKTEL